MTEKTLTELQNRLRYGDSNHDKVKTGLVMDMTDSFVHKDDGADLVAAGINATAEEINMAADNSANSEVVVTTNVITAAESGKTFFLTLADGFASTLPAPALGLRYKFIVATNPTTAYTIATNGGANVIKGGINELEVDTADDGPYSNVGDLISFVANVAVVGDWCEVISDGTSWFLTGQTNADGGITIGST